MNLLGKQLFDTTNQIIVEIDFHGDKGGYVSSRRINTTFKLDDLLLKYHNFWNSDDPCTFIWDKINLELHECRNKSFYTSLE